MKLMDGELSHVLDARSDLRDVRRLVRDYVLYRSTIIENYSFMGEVLNPSRFRKSVKLPHFLVAPQKWSSVDVALPLRRSGLLVLGPVMIRQFSRWARLFNLFTTPLPPSQRSTESIPRLAA